MEKDRVQRYAGNLEKSIQNNYHYLKKTIDHWGNDWPESQTQALWSIATGAVGTLGPYLAERVGCPAGRWGYPCFRPGTIPIVILFSAGLASMALTPPAYPIPNVYEFINPMISLYHLSMFGLALALAIVSPEPCADQDTIAVGERVWRFGRRWLAARQPAK